LREIPRDKVASHQFGFRFNPNGFRGVTVRLKIARACDASLSARHRNDRSLLSASRRPEVPIEETVGAMAGLSRLAKYARWDFRKLVPKRLRRARQVHPIAALQSEYSLWSRDVETNGVLATCRELVLRLCLIARSGVVF